MQALNNIHRLSRVFIDMLHYSKRAIHEGNPNGKPENTALHPIMMEWASIELKNLGVETKVKGSPSKDPVLFVGNHLSYLDIPVLMSLTPVVFIAKLELSKWPIIGSACRSVGTVWVKRESRDSRQSAGESIARTYFERKQSVVIFPSGTTSITEETPWRKGAFQIAKMHGLRIQPFRLTFEPLEIAAFVGEDAFVPHLWRLLNRGKILAQVEFHEPVEVVDPEADSKHWWEWSRAVLPISAR